MRTGNRLLRLWHHAITGSWSARRLFPPAVLDAIEQRVAEGERRHGAEIRIAIEAAREPGSILAGQSSRDRALEVFGLLRVWDTAANNGVLVHVMLADHAVEIVADREAAARVDALVWQRACASLASSMSAGEPAGGMLAAIDQINSALAAAFPIGGDDRNELPDRPRLL